MVQSVLGTFLAVTAVLVVLSAPVFLVTWRKDRKTATRNFVLGGVTLAIACAALAGISERQVEQCRAAGNSDCVDAGAMGLQLVLIAGYVIASWIVAWAIYRE